jgi:DNA-binding transcriptional LysR family regulator
VELYQLRSFTVVAEVGNLTRAADRLHISQPALSAQIKALEDELGVALFERSSSGMVLTAGGHRLLPEAEKVLAAAQALQAQARALKGELAGRARIGTVSDPEFIRVGELLNVAMERYPLLQIELHQAVSGEAYEQVKSGELDASFYFGTLAHPAVAGLQLGETAYRVVAPAQWCDRLAQADWAELAAMPWIMTPSISTHNQLVTELFRGRAAAPAQVVVADQEAVIATLVVSGVGVALMREDLAREKQAAGEVCLWRDARGATPLWLIYPAERASDPVIAALLDVLREIWGVRETGAAPARQPARLSRGGRASRSPA